MVAFYMKNCADLSMTENGLELEFGSRFYYTNALKNRESLIQKIHTVTGDRLNVVFVFSEALEDERQKEVQEQERRKAEEEKKNLQKEDLYADLLDAFDGKEVK